MKTSTVGRSCAWVAMFVGSLVGLRSAMAQTLLLDEFDGTHGAAAYHPGGVVDVTTYRVPFGGTTGDDFVGRTNFDFTLPQDGVMTTAPLAGSTDGKVAVLTLDTFNGAAPGASFLGTDVISKRNFAVGGGLRMTTRMRVQAGAPGGLVAAPFLYDTQRESPPGTLVRDEIDHEILTNNAQSAGPDNTLTNVWNDGNFASGGAPVTISNPSGFDVTVFHDYRTDWTPSSVKWYIDGALVRTETSVVPDDPMRAHMNFWAPDSTFAAAYNPALNPTATSPGTTYRVEVDRLQIDRINTTVSANLLADGSFEAFDDVGNWTRFGNTFRASGPVPAQEGFQALKVFGPFSGNTNASGAFQNVAAAPGQQFEGSVWAYAPSADSILGKQNYTSVVLQFVNTQGSVIGSVNFSPGTNQKDTPIFDGRDPNMVQDAWVQYTVNAVAPAGTAFVRMNEFFIQLYHSGIGDGGAVWFDNASLVRLTPDVVPLTGDYNGNGIVDGADYVLWRNDPASHGGTPGGYNTWRANFGLTAGAGSGVGVGAGAAVPEPMSLVLVVSGAIGLLFFNRRR